MLNTLAEWLTYIESIHYKKMDCSLERVTVVANKLSLLDLSPSKVIIVGGTNGKGSVSKLLETILQHANYTVGLFTSPHLINFNERIRINNQEVTDLDLIRAFNIIELNRGIITLTYFEYATLAALYLFKQNNLQFIILEVGLGGRGDAVNIVKRDVSVITSISYDHMHYLGNTLADIALEKAYIYRNSSYCIYSADTVYASVDEYCQQNNIKLQILNRDFKYQHTQKLISWQHGKQLITDINLPNVLPINLSSALECLYGLGLDELLVSNKLNIYLNNYSLYGRYSKFGKQQNIIVDVAHNISACKVLAARLRAENYQNYVAIFAMCVDKDLTSCMREFSELFDTWEIILFSDYSRMAKNEHYQACCNELAIKNFNINQQFSIKLLPNSNKDTCYVVFGSFKIVAAFKNLYLDNDV